MGWTTKTYAAYKAKLRTTAEGRATLKAYKKRYESKNPIRTRAHNALAWAVYNGKIIKHPCEVCGSVKSQGHHDDYSKPLEVKWLCQKHHKELHKQLRGKETQ